MSGTLNVNVENNEDDMGRTFCSIYEQYGDASDQKGLR